MHDDQIENKVQLIKISDYVVNNGELSGLISKLEPVIDVHEKEKEIDYDHFVEERVIDNLVLIIVKRQRKEIVEKVIDVNGNQINDEIEVVIDIVISELNINADGLVNKPKLIKLIYELEIQLTKLIVVGRKEAVNVIHKQIGEVMRSGEVVTKIERDEQKNVAVELVVAIIRDGDSVEPDEGVNISEQIMKVIEQQTELNFITSVVKRVVDNVDHIVTKVD